MRLWKLRREPPIDPPSEVEIIAERLEAETPNGPRPNPRERAEPGAHRAN